MRARSSVIAVTLCSALAFGGWLLLPRPAGAHCDTMDGPIVKTAQAALAKGNVTSVLKWVRSHDEAEVRAAFRQALLVRAGGTEAKHLADRFFFETLVRLHRASEGEPYTGLKPAGTVLGPAVAGADKALETGSVDALVGMVTREVGAGIRARFSRAVQTRKRSESSVEAGREYVEAYVQFVHYVETIHMTASGKAAHHDEAQ